jgi:hypothetical protein
MIEKMLSAYKKVYGKKFEMKNFDDRIKMQKCNYILAMSGMGFTKFYKYIWCDYGPYSSELSDDLKIYYDKDREIQYEFDEVEEKLLNRLIKMISDVSSKCEYTDRDIVEAKASLMFLEELGICSNQSETLNELMNRKPHLSKSNINEEILQYNL